ncbi:MAG: flagellar biosynthesis protein FlgA [Alphaproteobacteria bacterium]|nr:flagellar biosynthesis protein FlgA [Alphaproteobacteria bacterium]
MIHFLVHHKQDTVGVAVVEDIKAGQTLTGWVMETDETVKLKAVQPIPLGHKIALQNHPDKGTVLKYGHDIGRTVFAIRKGEHVHVHNLKTRRW